MPQTSLHKTNGSSNSNQPPLGNLQGFRTYFRNDLLSGFLVFLIALPLCLAISNASGFPPIAGIFTAVVGSIVATVVSNSELTIKGPAAGLIVVVLGCIEAFGGDGMLNGWSAADHQAYRATLAVGVVAAVLQVIFGFFRAGIVGDFFPISAVHGMLAAIGVIIIAKQIPVAVGVSASGSPLDLLSRIPDMFMAANPAIAVIGGTSIAIMFAWPSLRVRVPYGGLIPAPLIVLCIAVPMGMYFDLTHEHEYFLQNHQYHLGEEHLVAMPDHVFGVFDYLETPDWSALKQPVAWTWVFMFFAIGSLESLLSAKAVDFLDPNKRKSNMDRDMIAVGIGNAAVSMIGGLPMISEIVRSKANIDNGAKTRFANFWHGMFLLVCVTFIPMLLHRIPMAALAAMLIYTGFRLAHPSEFMNVLRIGREQLVIFAVTLLAVLATDLLIGIGIGILTKIVIHLSNGVPLHSLFKPEIQIADDDGTTVRIVAYKSAVFSNWIPIRRQIERVGLLERKHIEFDVAETQLVDHSVMDKLHEMALDFEQQGLQFKVIGLDSHRPMANHTYSARLKSLSRVQRLTVVTSPDLESKVTQAFLALGASGYTSIPCTGAGRHDVSNGKINPQARVRIEVIATKSVCDTMIDHLRRHFLTNPDHPITFAVESVSVSRFDGFADL